MPRHYSLKKVGEMLEERYPDTKFTFDGKGRYWYYRGANLGLHRYETLEEIYIAFLQLMIDAER